MNDKITKLIHTIDPENPEDLDVLYRELERNGLLGVLHRRLDETREVEAVKGCYSCPLWDLEFDAGYCAHPVGPNHPRERHDVAPYEREPEWCPLHKGPLMVRLQRAEEREEPTEEHLQDRILMVLEHGPSRPSEVYAALHTLMSSEVFGNLTQKMVDYKILDIDSEWRLQVTKKEG